MALQRLKSWTGRLKVDVIALWIAARDDRTPVLAKVVAYAVAAFALSTVDLIPDFIPILGYLDDLIIVPLGVACAIRLIPSPLMADFRKQTRMISERPKSRTAMAFIILLWLGVSILGALWPLCQFASHLKRKMGADISAGPHFRRVSRSASLSRCDHRTRRAIGPPQRLCYRVGSVCPAGRPFLRSLSSLFDARRSLTRVHSIVH